MSSLGKVTAALASATNELTVAAANFNLDFSIMKVEAPTEFQPLGKVLSEQRRDEAENGIPHITAQKLGALFKDIPPHTPELVKAYGNRVSEISQIPAANAQTLVSNTAFASHAGADGTSIWAAATSGPGALPIQLLTCMLARLWNGPEATSAWVELVKERKLEIAKKCEQGEVVDFGTLMATRQQISRNQLSEWDASARAWLRTADDVKRLEQTQLMLIIDNLDIPVNHDMRVYSSVMEAWKKALQSLERMVVGMPQSLHEDGAILLGLSAWHLYPDLLVLGGTDQAKNITMKDSLIAPGGVLTIGLQMKRDDDPRGIYWSLSLAHLRYYGDPVVRQRNFARDSSRIQIEQLMQVTIGSLSTSWGSAGCDALSIAAFLTAIGDLFDRVNKMVKGGNLSREQSFCEEFRRLGPNWLQSLIIAAKSITDAAGVERDTILRLINVGIKHGKDFLVAHSASAFLDPVFGLCDLKRLLPLLRGCEPRIRILRKLATRYGMRHEDVIIRYEVYPDVSNNLGTQFEQEEMESSDIESSEIASELDESPSDHETEEPSDLLNANSAVMELEEAQDSYDDESSDSLHLPPLRPSVLTSQQPTNPRGRLHQNSHFEYASASPQIRPSAKRTSAGEECNKEIYQRWLKKEEFWMHNTLPRDPTMVCDCIGKCREGFCACFRRNTLCTSACQTSTPNNRHDECENTESARLYSSRLSKLQAAGEECFLQDEENFKCRQGVLDSFKVRTKDDLIEYTLFAGDPETAAIFVRRNSQTSDTVLRSLSSHHLNMNELISIFTSEPVMADALLEFLSGSTRKSNTVASLSGKQFLAPDIELPDTSMRLEEASRHFSASNCLYQSLKALTIAAEVYKLLPGATVDIGVIRRTMSAWKWTNVLFENRYKHVNVVPLHNSRLEALKSGWLDRNSTFSSVATFESGHCDIDPGLLNGVMAVSSGDSIFVAAPLLCDPIENPRAYELRRILGNVGRPGITMLVPPSNLLIRSVGPEKWNVINHTEFDGKDEDNFKGTSLHLSFTEYNPSVNLGLHGAQDAEVFILESIVSVHDHGTWIADLDILGVLGKLLYFQQMDCRHGIGELPTKKFTSIDTWDELLDRSEGSVGIARAHCNWVARLTLVATSLSQGVPTMLCPRATCWKCFEHHILNLPDLVVVH